MASRLRMPLLLIAASKDTIAPPSAVERVARRTSGPVSVERFGIGHFEIYLGEPFEKSAAAQVEFLCSLPVQT